MAAWRRRCLHIVGGASLAPPLDPAPAPDPDLSAPAVCPARGCQCRRFPAMEAPRAPGPDPGRKELKIVIVGDGGCGKTSLLMVYSQGSFPEVRPTGRGWWGLGYGGNGLGTIGGDRWPSAWTLAPGRPARRGSRHPGAPPREFQSPSG